MQYGVHGVEWSGTYSVLVSAVHELLTLIKDHHDVLNHDFLLKVVKQLHPTSRKGWKSLIAAASGATPRDDFGRMLLRIRNQMVFHYDLKGIFGGFKTHFLLPTRLQDRAFISRGLSMSASRFIFADAAVEGYFGEIVGKGEIGQLSMKVHDVVDSLNFALLGLVDQFIQQRGFAYRNV